MSEKIKLLITEIKESPWKKSDTETVVYYNCKTAAGTEYTTTDPQVKQFLNIEHEFDVNSKEDRNKVMKHYINFPKAGGGGFGGGKNWGGGGKSYGPDPIITAKNTILMQLVELVKIYKGEESRIPNAEDALKFIEKNMDRVWATYGYKTPEIKPDATTGPSTGQVPRVLSREKQVIIYKAMQRMNFRAKDLIAFAGNVGIEIHYQPEEDKAKVSELSEDQGQKLINALAEEATIPF